MAKVQRELFSPAKYIPRSTVCKVSTNEAFLVLLKGVTRVNLDWIMCPFIKGKVLLLFACYAGVVTTETKGTFVWSIALIKNTVMKQINQGSFV